MAKSAIVLLAEGFEDIEAVTVVDILRRASLDVVVAGVGGVKICGSRKTTILADKEFDGGDANFDVVVLPGGLPGATNLAASAKVTDFITSSFKAGKVIAAICAAPAVVLAPLGILDNISATCYPDMYDRFNSTTKYKDARVVVDGNVITSQAAGTAFSFALAIVEKLAGKSAADKIRVSTVAGL